LPIRPDMGQSEIEFISGKVHAFFHRAYTSATRK
jgi:hypothetical protein